MKQLKFVEDFYITDYKLLLCTIACCFSLFALGYDYVAPFPKSIYVLASCVVSYPYVMLLLVTHVQWVARVHLNCGQYSIASDTCLGSNFKAIVFL